MVQQPLNPGVPESARQLLDRTSLRWPEALQLGSALTARDMFPGTEITFVASSAALLDAARAEGLVPLDPSNIVPSGPPEAGVDTASEAAQESE